MSKRSAKAQASSARASSTPFGASSFGSAAPAFGASLSQLSYVSEPPDLSSISDPNVVVYFRNLSKKDSTTKAKALEELQSYVSSLKDPIEEGILEAWITSYPRTSIDNAKSVRQNAHTLQGYIAASAGKRIAKYMPRSVAAWLCGLYDSDRSVVEATQAALRQVFNTPEKIQSIRKAYQQAILEYCQSAIEKETPTTLSDERITSPDDAEAKYSRVISACTSILGSLLSNLQPEELSKFQSDYEALLGNKKLWDLSAHVDASVRRAVHRFLKTSIEKQPEAVETNLETISKSYLSVALNSDQMNSIIDYVDALTVLTSKYPSIWTEHYKSKTNVDRRLRQFLKKGSQLGPRDFWSRLAGLIKLIPREVLPSNAADAAEFLNAIQGGILRKEESKFNHEAAFTSYFAVTDLVVQQLPADDKKTILEEMVLPIIGQYLRPAAETSQWNIPTNAAPALLLKAMSIEGMPHIMESNWPGYSQKLIEDMKTSAPEQSKDYEKSQSTVLQHATRFAALQTQALNSASVDSMRPVFQETCSSIVSEALNLVKNRNGKPYSAAGAVAVLLLHNRTLLSQTQTEADILQFAREDLPGLLSSPSSPYLIDLLYAMADDPSFKDTWSSALKAILQEPDSPQKTKALEALLTSSHIPASFNLAASDDELQRYVTTSVRGAVEGTSEWDTFTRVLQSRATILSSSTTDEVLSYLTESLSMSQRAPYSLQGLRHIVKSDPSLLKSFMMTSQGSKLLQSLLLASESPDEVFAQDAIAVNSTIQTMLSAGSDSKRSMYDLIHQGLREATPTSVSVETLVDLAKQSVGAKPTWEDMEKVIPTLGDWDAALGPFFSIAPRSSLAITNSLGGAVYAVDSKESFGKIKAMSRDVDGYSAAYRIAQYFTRLFADSSLSSLESMPAGSRDSFVRNLAITIQLANDNLGLAGANGLWSEYNSDVEIDAMSFLSEAQKLINQDVDRLKSSWSDSTTGASATTWAIELLSTIDGTASPRAYYAARAYSNIISEAFESIGWKSTENALLQDTLKALRRSRELFPTLGFLHAFQEPLAASNSCERMCNEIIADLTGLDIQQKPTEGLRQLVSLNAVLEQDGITSSIAKQRLVFFVKHVVPWLQDDEAPRNVKAELCRAMMTLLPLMSDMYGEHWVDILRALAATWKETKELEENESGYDSPVPHIHASLKLYAQLRSLLQDEEHNDDLVDAWKETEQDVAHGLINLLKHSQHFPDDFHQPLKMVNDVLARQIARVPLKHIDATEELYPLLYVESQPVQQTAFNILHKQIPAAQEQISIDAALDKTTARLPEELLSLIIDAPTVAALASANFERSVPLPLRGYLLSWLLIFDHLEHASFKVKNDYVEHIKEGDYLPGLLGFTFDFLGHAHNKPADVSKLDVTTYEPDVESPKRDLQWLLTHLYYLCLLHVPSLTKSWFISCKSRATVVTLEPWTERIISPPVINAALQSVSTWSEQQSTSDPDSPFSVKVAPRAREITASYTVDEQTMSMKIALPAAFPLTNAHIEGINRVAVNEQKWQSWLRTSLGAITIFNGSLIDALTTFKRNVDGAMKGQTECAICYSIVGSDRKLPDKRCQTCKNLFHGSCLFKWFKSSGSSSCPLCRNPFNYG